MKLRTKRGVSKMRQMSGKFQNLIAGGTRSLVRHRNQEKRVNKAWVHCIKITFHLSGALGGKHVSSQDCRSLS